MRRKPLVIIGAMVAGLALGIVLGPAARTSVASAQSQSTAPGGSLWNTFLDQLASALNIQRTALDSAISTAGTNTADTAVQQGTLTQAQADALKARIQSGDLGALFGGRRGGPRMDAGVQQAMVEAAAKALNLTTDELRTKLRDGSTLAELAQAAGTTEQAVKDAALAAAKARLDAAVAAGTLTQAQADSVYTRLQQDGVRLLGPHGRGFGGPGAPGAPPPDATGGGQA